MPQAGSHSMPSSNAAEMRAETMTTSSQSSNTMLQRTQFMIGTSERVRVTSVRLSIISLVALSALVPTLARAADGCTVLLCLAAPKWSAIPQCVAPIRQLFNDLARGRSFPTCKMGNGGNGGTGNTSASNAWAQAPTLCPPQYTHLLDIDPGPAYSCDYTGAVSVVINGALFARTWWNTDGQTVTEFTPGAKSQLGTWDPQFDADYSAWLAAQSAPVPGDSR
jgi:hypothetical protein